MWPPNRCAGRRALVKSRLQYQLGAQPLWFKDISAECDHSGTHRRREKISIRQTLIPPVQGIALL